MSEREASRDPGTPCGPEPHRIGQRAGIPALDPRGEREPGQPWLLAVEILSAEGLDDATAVHGVAPALAAVLDGFDQALGLLLGHPRFQMLVCGAAVRAAPSHLGRPRTFPRRGDLLNQAHLRCLLHGAERPREAAVALVAELLELVADLVGWPQTLSLLGERWSWVGDDWEDRGRGPVPRRSQSEGLSGGR
jgi:hypothetical protein